jgi:hypothetical protein
MTHGRFDSGNRVAAKRGLGGAIGLTVALIVAASACPRRARAEVVARSERTHFALGGSFGFLRQEDLGRQTTTRFVPSLVGLAYINVAPRVFLRPGLRLGYAGLSQPGAASDARVEEHGALGRAEIGVLYDGWIVPAISVGMGIERRSIDFVAHGDVQDSGILDRAEWLGSVYAQAGLGVPLFRGRIVIEPYARLQRTFSDDRSASEVGLDVTFPL